MSAKNDITGDQIQTKALSKQGRDNWDNIFRKKPNEAVYSNSDHPRKGKPSIRVANPHRGSDFKAGEFSEG